MSGNLYTRENPVFAAFMFHSALILLKMMVMTLVTAWVRYRNDSVQTTEDLHMVPNDPEVRRKALLPNEKVERVRRCHRNDLENIYVYLFFALLYIATDPPLATALLYFRVYTISRYCHSIIYLNAGAHFYRSIAYGFGYLICLIMAVSTIASVM